jgi:hypothetical protein
MSSRRIILSNVNGLWKRETLEVIASVGNRSRHEELLKPSMSIF